MIGLLLAVAFFGIAWRRSLRAGLIALLTSILLIPSTLFLPGSSLLTIQRLTAFALLLNMVRMIRRRELSSHIFAATPVHFIFVIMLAVTFAVGVVFAQPFVSVVDSSHIWANYFTEFFVFIVALAAIRAIGDTMFVARVLAVLLLISAGIAIIEHFTGGSYARLFFKHTKQASTGAANMLQTRGSEVRVRVV